MAEFDVAPDLVRSTPPKDVKGPEGDSQEQAPTAVARAIEHGRPDTLGASGVLHLQRAAGNAAMATLVQRSEDESPVHAAMSSSSGSPLSTAMRSKMEGSFGVDFSGVKVHTDSSANQAAQSVQAKAFTTGQDIFFNKGQNPDDEHTMAHELTHVIQQSQGPVAGTSNGQGVSVSDPSDAFEQQAERTAHAVTSGGPAAAPAGSVQASKLQRLEDADLQRLPLQRADAETEEDEPAQALALQRADAETEEDEPAQALALQRADAETEEDEPAQALALQRAEAEDDDLEAQEA